MKCRQHSGVYIEKCDMCAELQESNQSHSRFGLHLYSLHVFHSGYSALSSEFSDFITTVVKDNNQYKSQVSQ